MTNVRLWNLTMNEEENISENSSLQKFLVVGIITSEDFQKSRYAVCKLHKSFPKEFDSPDIRPMLDVEWNEFITKYRRRLGNGLWSVHNRVVIFKNGEFLGDFSDLKELIWKKWKYIFNQDWHDLASKHLAEYLEEKVAHCRQLVYLTIAINSHVIGSLLFELYSDIVPLACENFITRCRNEDKGYCGTPIHRIVKNSWVQCGGYNLKPIRMPCENYVVPHNRRGVLSTCNNARHRDNSTQFYISLASAPWMDYRYVAFGYPLIHGDDILKTIEDVPTYYQAPVSDIVIVKCGEYKTRLQATDSTLLYTADEIDQWKEIQQQMDVLTYLRSYHNVDGGEGHRRDSQTKGFEPLQSMDSYESVLHPSKVKFGTYSLKSDVKSYGPFSHLPDILSDDDNDEGAEDYNICGPDYLIRKHKNQMYDDSLTPRASDITL